MERPNLRKISEHKDFMDFDKDFVILKAGMGKWIINI